MMAEMSEEEGGWVSKLRQYNSRHGRDIGVNDPLEDGGNSEEDKQLLEEYYVKFKGDATSKYSVIPKFYSKVLTVKSLALVKPFNCTF